MTRADITNRKKYIVPITPFEDIFNEGFLQEHLNEVADHMES